MNHMSPADSGGTQLIGKPLYQKTDLLRIDLELGPMAGGCLDQKYAGKGDHSPEVVRYSSQAYLQLVVF